MGKQLDLFRASLPRDLSCEQLARAQADRRPVLRELLREHLALLKPILKPFFRGATFDFENKRLVGKEGFELRWSLRDDPSAPPSYHNQQTSLGNVEVFVNSNLWSDKTRSEMNRAIALGEIG